MWVLIAVGAGVLINYMRTEGKGIQDYWQYLAIGGLILYAIGTKKAEVTTYNSAQDAIKLGEGLMDEKVKRNEYPAGTKCKVGPYCDLKIHDGQPRYYVASTKIIKPDGDLIHGGIRVNYEKPGNPRLFKTFGELRGDEEYPSVYLPGRLAGFRKQYPWLFRGGGGA